MVTIDVIEDRRRLARLGDEWNALLQRSRSDSFFLTWEWISTWWETYGARYRSLVLAARDGDALVGVAPLMLSSGDGRVRRHFRHLMFIGQNEEVTPEYLDFFIEPGREAEVSAAFCDHLALERRDDWDRLHLQRILTSSPNLPAMVRLLRRRGVDLVERDRAASPYTALPSSWNAFLSARSKHFRKRVRYRERQLEVDGTVEYLVAGEEVSLDVAFDELVRLNRLRWGEAGESFRSPDYTRFHRRLARRLLDRGWLVMVLMAVRDTIVAAEYNFGYAGKIWGNQGGWLPEWANRGVASVLGAHMLRWGIERGYAEYDFLAGDSPYKRKWATGEREIVDLEAVNDTLRGHAFRYARRGKQTLSGIWDVFGNRVSPALLASGGRGST